MAVKIITEEVERDVAEISEMRVDRISFVKHGSNRRPFKLIKSEEDEMHHIQSVIVPKNVKLAAVYEMPRMGWLSKADIKTVEARDRTEKHTIVPVEDFDAASIDVEDMGGGIVVVHGKLTRENQNAIEFNRQSMTSHLDTPVPAAATEYVPTLYEQAVREFAGLQGLVFGCLEQSGAEPKQILKTIKSGLNAFESFLSNAFSSILQKGDEDMDETTVKKIVDGALSDSITPKLDQVTKVLNDLIKAQETVPDKDSNPPDPMAELTEKVRLLTAEMEALKTENADLKRSNETLQESLKTDLGTGDTDGDSRGSKEDLTMTDDETPGIWSNFLVNKAALDKALSS